MSRDTTTAGIGHNAPAGAPILAFLERVERLTEDKKSVSDEIKDVYAEAKGQGYDVKILRKLVGLRSQDPDKRREEMAILELYAEAIGMEV
jgi:uncharacterized protein (UPF0335 family)